MTRAVRGKFTTGRRPPAGEETSLISPCQDNGGLVTCFMEKPSWIQTTVTWKEKKKKHLLILTSWEHKIGRSVEDF